MDVRNTFASRLKKLREEQGLSQTALANKLHISRGSISYYENRDRMPDIETLYLICNFFDASGDYLIGRSDNRHAENAEFGEILGLSDNSIDNIKNIEGHESALQKDISGFYFHESQHELWEKYLDWGIEYTFPINLSKKSIINYFLSSKKGLDKFIDIFINYCNMYYLSLLRYKAREQREPSFDDETKNSLRRLVNEIHKDIKFIEWQADNSVHGFTKNMAYDYCKYFENEIELGDKTDILEHRIIKENRRKRLSALNFNNVRERLNKIKSSLPESELKELEYELSYALHKIKCDVITKEDFHEWLTKKEEQYGGGHK